MEAKQFTFIQTITISVLTSVVTLGCGYLLFIHPMTLVGEPAVLNDDTDTTAQLFDETQSIPDVVETAIPAVVSITISADVPVIEQYYDDYWSPFGGTFQIPRQRQIGTERQEIGGGTGFFVSADGYLVTNRHVVDQEGVEYSVVTNEGDTYEVTVVAIDPALDVAILKVDAEADFPFLTFADIKGVRLGAPVIAIGNALAEFPNSVSVGVVSGLSRDIIAGDGFRFRESLEGVIQTDAAINRGNSGGPLLNTQGEVIGVNVAVAGSGENIGFALPSNVVSAVFESVATYGEIVRPFLGVRYVQITPELATRNGLASEYGVLIVSGENPDDVAVLPDSSAARAGLKEGDIILEIEGQKLDGTQSLASLLRTYGVGDSITLNILQDGREQNVTIELERE